MSSTLDAVHRRWRNAEEDHRRALATGLRALAAKAEAGEYGDRRCPGDHGRAIVLAAVGLCPRCTIELDEALLNVERLWALLIANVGRLGTSGMARYVGPSAKGAPPLPLDLATDTLCSEIQHALDTAAELVDEHTGSLGAWLPARVLHEGRTVLLALPRTPVWRWSQDAAEWRLVELDGGQLGAEFIQLYERALRRLGQDRRGDRLAAPCPDCECVSLIARPGAGVECDVCDFVCGRDEYARWQTYVVGWNYAEQEARLHG